MAELVKNYDNGSAIKIVYSYSQNVSKNQSTLTMSLYVHRDLSLIHISEPTRH